MIMGVLEMIVTMVTVATMRMKMVMSDKETIIFDDLSFTEQNCLSIFLI
jgi:hypothetical protein